LATIEFRSQGRPLSIQILTMIKASGRQAVSIAPIYSEYHLRIQMNVDWYFQTAIVRVGCVIGKIGFLWLSFEYPLPKPYGTRWINVRSA
jgi:hypothetical protein